MLFTDQLLHSTKEKTNSFFFCFFYFHLTKTWLWKPQSNLLDNFTVVLFGWQRSTIKDPFIGSKRDHRRYTLP